MLRLSVLVDAPFWAACQGVDLETTATRIPRPHSTEEHGLHELGDDLKHLKTARTKN